MYGINDLCILEDQREHYAVIEIRIKECKGRALKIIQLLIKLKDLKLQSLDLE